MTSDEKVKWMRDKVYEQEALMGLGVAVITLLPVEQEVIDPSADIFAFLGGGKVDPTPPRTVVVMTTEEQQSILRRLEKEGLIQIQDMTGLEAFIAVNPKPPAPLKLKTMEHIARTLADKFTGADLQYRCAKRLLCSPIHQIGNVHSVSPAVHFVQFVPNPFSEIIGICWHFKSANETR